MPDNHSSPAITTPRTNRASSLGFAIALPNLHHPQPSGPRQAILRAAFAGRLVPQDPADEPASRLLARLQASRPTPTRRQRTTA